MFYNTKKVDIQTIKEFIQTHAIGLSVKVPLENNGQLVFSVRGNVEDIPDVANISIYREDYLLALNYEGGSIVIDSNIGNVYYHLKRTVNLNFNLSGLFEGNPLSSLLSSLPCNKKDEKRMKRRVKKLTKTKKLRKGCEWWFLVEPKHTMLSLNAFGGYDYSYYSGEKIYFTVREQNGEIRFV